MALELIGVRAVVDNYGTYISQLKNIERQTDSVGGATKRLGTSAAAGFKALAVAAAAAVTAVSGVAVASIAAASKYQTTLAQIDALTNTSAEDTERLGKAILDMAKRLPKSPDELGAAAYFALSSGINDVGEALKVVEIAAKISSAGLGETKQIVDVLTSVINAYGKENISAAQAGDILVATVREGKGEASEFASAIGGVIPIAAALGVKFEEVAALLAVITNTGDNAAEAVTKVRGILNQLAAPSDKAKKALAAIGTTSVGLRKEIERRGLIPVMLDLSKSFKNNEEAAGDFIEALSEIFPDVRGFIGFLSAFESQGDATTRVLQNIRNAAGITDEAFERMSKTFDFQFKVLKNQLNVALIQLGSVLLPIATRAVQSLIRVFEDVKPDIEAFAKDLKELAHLFGLGFEGGRIFGNFSDLQKAAFEAGQKMRETLDFIKEFGLPVTKFGVTSNLEVLRDVAVWFIDHTAALAAVGAVGFGWLALSHPIGAILFGAAVSVTVFKLLREDLDGLNEPLLRTRREIDKLILKFVDLVTTIGTLGLNKLLGFEAPKTSAIGGLRESVEADIAAIDRLLAVREEQAERVARVAEKAKKAGMDPEEFVRLQLQALSALGPGIGDTVESVSDLVQVYDDLKGEVGAALRDFPRLRIALDQVTGTSDELNKETGQIGPTVEKQIPQFNRLGDEGKQSLEKIQRAAEVVRESIDKGRDAGGRFQDLLQELSRMSIRLFVDSSDIDEGIRKARELIAAMREAGEEIAASEAENINAAQGFQHGGFTMGRRPIVVGERGPEVFVPASSGLIIPNNVTQRLLQSNTFAPVVNLQGATLDQMHSNVLRWVNSFFNDLRRSTVAGGAMTFSEIG